MRTTTEDERVQAAGAFLRRKLSAADMDQFARILGERDGTKRKLARDQAPVDKDKLIEALLGVVSDIMPRGVAKDAVSEPYDDVTQELSDLKKFLQANLKPNALKEADDRIVKLIERCSELIKHAHIGMNNGDPGAAADDDPQLSDPRDIPGSVKPGGGIVPLTAMDSLRARLDAPKRAAETARRNMLRHMSRIGNL
jgi:hypothetical protein